MARQKATPQQQQQLNFEQQLSFDTNALKVKRFTLANLVTAKLNRLAQHMDRLTHSDVVWLSRVEEFFSLHEYITERQLKVLDSIVNRHEKHMAQ